MISGIFLHAGKPLKVSSNQKLQSVAFLLTGNSLEYAGKKFIILIMVWK